MYRTLADSKFLGCLPHRRIIIYNVICNRHCPFFDIFLHGTLPYALFLQCMQSPTGFMHTDKRMYSRNAKRTYRTDAFIECNTSQPKDKKIQASKDLCPHLPVLLHDIRFSYMYVCCRTTLSINILSHAVLPSPVTPHLKNSFAFTAVTRILTDLCIHRQCGRQNEGEDRWNIRSNRPVRYYRPV